MKTSYVVFIVFALFVVWFSLHGNAKDSIAANTGKIKALNAFTGETETVERVVKTDDEWKKILTPEQYRIMRAQGTERAFTGEYHNHKGDGVYQCAACGNHLFSSKSKYDSGTGWPSFWKAVSEMNIKTKSDDTFFMKRTEVLCARCDAHLGHVFNDGPQPTGLRYCLNSPALKFVKKDK